MFFPPHTTGRKQSHYRAGWGRSWQLALVCVLLLSGSAVSNAQRSLGIDVSAWQGNISQATWNNIRNTEDREFVFIRSSRGGTTGFYNQSDPDNSGGQNTLSQRYDDPYFAQNITRATNAGMHAGPYHFSRPDILTNTGTDEANHFLEMAGAWMRPGYLLPVHDLESGAGIRSSNDMAQFAVDFSDRIFEVAGFRPALYSGGNYTHFVLKDASLSLRNQVVAAYPTLWVPRWPNESDPDSIPVQTDHPSSTISWVYGIFDDPPNPTHPWSFWQYTSKGRLNSYKNGNGNLDFNVAQGGQEFLKDHLVPALWMNDLDGQWTTLSNWNSGQAPVAPVQGPGQVPRVGVLDLPAVRLPTGNDTVVLDRPGAAITITLAEGDHTIRKLEVHEELNITGGSLSINYVPTADSTSHSARFFAPVSLTGASLSVHTLVVDAQQTFSLGGSLTLDTLQLVPHNTSPARLQITGNVEFQPLANAAATITVGQGAGNSGYVDLGGENRTWKVANGSALVDLAVDVPIANGGLTKTGEGLLELSGANTYSGDTAILEGGLSLVDPWLADVADIYLESDGALNLEFNGIDVVDALYINGVSQPTGTWGGVGSGAEFESPLILGAGLLQVSTAEPPIPGDFNYDGFVNNDDLEVFQTGFGVNNLSDADQDGDSDGNDFLAWQRNHSQTADPLAVAQSIPEPTTDWLLAGAVTCWFCRRTGL